MGIFPGLILKPIPDIPRNGLVAEYLFSGNADDTSGNGYDGINNGGTFVDDRHANANSAISLNGSTNYIDIDAALTGLGTNTIGSWSFWINMVDATPAGPAEEFISFARNTTVQFILCDQLSSGKTRVFVTDGSSDDKWGIITDNIELSNNTWYNIIIIQDGIEPVLYIDNVKVGQSFSVSNDKTWWFNDASGIANGHVGTLDFDNRGKIFHLNGIMDDIRFYDRDLTSEERTILFNE